MPVPAHFGSVSYGLGAVLAWGTSDFLGGYATRRANAFLFTTLVNVGGLVMMLTLAAATHAAVPSTSAIAWALAGGISGGASLAVFYRALATGKMGLAAPVAAVLSAAIPTLVSIFTEGPPSAVQMTGFVLAVAGLWLITRTEDGSRPEGIGLAVFAGVGFAGFYLCIRQAGELSPIWAASLTRSGGFLVTGIIVLAQKTPLRVSRGILTWGLLTGCVDSLGTILFVLASQSGRLDEAVVISSLYPAVTVLLARIFLREHFTRWKFVGLLAALASVPMVATG